MADQKFKSKVKLQGGVTLPNESGERALIINSSGDIVSSSVTDVELGHLDGVTGPIQTQIGDAQGDATQALSDASDAQADATQALSDAAGALAAAGAAQGDVDDHISDAAGAHAASAISNTPAGNLAATDVQAALNELQGDIDDLAGDIAALPDPITYEGTYDADTNTPTLADGIGNIGDLYQVNVAGTQDLGSGNITFAVGDKVVYNGATWDKWDMTDAVQSVNGQAGVVSLDSDDIDEGTSNLYFAESRVVATTLTGFDGIASGDINASDTIIQAFNKTQVLINAVESAASDAQADATQALSDAADALAAAGAAQSDIDDHISDSAGAHAASAISNTPSGNLAATTVQAALNELQDDIDALPIAPAGDINETSASIADNQASAANVTGLLFNPASVRSFKVLASVEIDGTVDLYEAFELVGINKNGVFDMSITAVGDESGVVLSITSGGQVQYTSATYAGYVSGTIKFRAITTSI